MHVIICTCIIDKNLFFFLVKMNTETAERLLQAAEENSSRFKQLRSVFFRKSVDYFVQMEALTWDGNYEQDSRKISDNYDNYLFYMFWVWRYRMRHTELQ